MKPERLLPRRKWKDMKMNQSTFLNKGERMLKHSLSLSRKARDQSDTKHDFWPQPAQFGAEAYGVCAAMAAFHAGSTWM
jgi:hypothetical protein